MDAKERAVELLKKHDVRWVHTAFTDIRGTLRAVVLPATRFTEGDCFTVGTGFDGSSVRGFKEIDESDMILKPDPATLAVLPWTSEGFQKSAIVLGDVYEAYGAAQPSEVCPRSYVSKRAVDAAKAMGYTGLFGPEVEHFVFKSIDPTKLTWDLPGDREV